MTDEKSEQSTIPDNEAPSTDDEMGQWLDELKAADPERRAALDRAILKKMPHLQRLVKSEQAPAANPAPVAPAPAAPAAESQEALYAMAPYMRPTQVKPQ